MSSKQIIYLAHGGEKYTNQAIFSLYSLLYWLRTDEDNAIEIVIYTDEDHWIPKHKSIAVRNITPDQLEQYKGEHQYVHRVKLEILRDAQSKSNGPMIFVDCDTQWKRNPLSAFEQLISAPNTCWMHQYEGEISPENHPDYYTALSCDPNLCTAFSPPWSMWNSGAIGIPESNHTFFSKALNTCDQLLNIIPNSNWVEQLAISLHATKAFEVKSLEPYLLHFWEDSVILPTVLDQALSKLSDDIEHNAEQCAKFPIEQELQDYRGSIKGRWLRQKAKWKRSISKQRRKNA